MKVSKDAGAIIRQARKNKGMTQEALAQLLGLQAPAIYKYEKRIVTDIPLEMLLKLHSALDVPLDKLIPSDELACNSISAFLSLVHQQKRQAIFTTDKFMLLDLWFYKSKPKNIEWLNYFAMLVLIGISEDEFDKIKTYIEFLRSQRPKTPPTHADDVKPNSTPAPEK
ncbi:MAG: helix-turn-helix transcriptional regulator [Phascolarctobacterium sp.]|uniref:helix-turn-helix domain-containing protein n=1 Tax=Phascolarctobacterium sp. TaxID=2049039 RepID=UPI0026DB4FD4|nr:helix-turn-helix transcriptional regulator [Phascolarctobacterium sp.]MDO4920219.1 helix-turn-helix transcriptional regulator [Phascolarctobacterium sp.]